MILRGLIDEDVVNYRRTSMYLAFPQCSFKCDSECGLKVCQNYQLSLGPTIEVAPETLCERYIKNPLTSAVVCAGLEPFDSKFDLLVFIDCLRRKYSCDDEIIIYTGYTEKELTSTENMELRSTYDNIVKYSNIIIKFGRFIPNQEPHYDEVLGVKLASPNQYAKKVS